MSITTLEQFKGYLQEMHVRCGDEVMMFQNARRIRTNEFMYDYDDLCSEAMRFNDDGSVEQ